MSVVLLSTEILLDHFLLYDSAYRSSNMEGEHTDGVYIFSMAEYLTERNQCSPRDWTKAQCLFVESFVLVWQLTASGTITKCSISAHFRLGLHTVLCIYTPMYMKIGPIPSLSLRNWFSAEQMTRINKGKLKEHLEVIQIFQGCVWVDDKALGRLGSQCFWWNLDQPECKSTCASDGRWKRRRGKKKPAVLLTFVLMRPI